MAAVAPGDRVRGRAETRASGPLGPIGEPRRVSFEGVVTAVDGDTVLVHVGRTDVRCQLDAVELLARGSKPAEPPQGSAAPQSAAITLDKLLEDARRIGASFVKR